MPWQCQVPRIIFPWIGLFHLAYCIFAYIQCNIPTCVPNTAHLSLSFSGWIGHFRWWLASHFSRTSRIDVVTPPDVTLVHRSKWFSSEISNFRDILHMETSHFVHFKIISVNVMEVLYEYILFLSSSTYGVSYNVLPMHKWIMVTYLLMNIYPAVGSMGFTVLYRWPVSAHAQRV